MKPHWIVQQNLANESAFETLIAELQRTETTYNIVDLRPIANKIVPDIDTDDPVFICGSTSLGKVAEYKGWTSYYFPENLLYENYLRYYGDYMLNKHAVVLPLKHYTKHSFEHTGLKEDDYIFFRPNADSKVIVGEVNTVSHFLNWKQQIIDLEKLAEKEKDIELTIESSDLFVVAPPMNIHAEYRFFVVDNDVDPVITGSQYQYHRRPVRRELCKIKDKELFDFVRKMIDIWSPSMAFSIDIALGDAGLRVLELGCINHTGFYAANIPKIVEAINQL